MSTILLGSAISQAKTRFAAERPDFIKVKKEADLQDKINQEFSELVNEAKQSLRNQLPEVVYRVISGDHNGYIKLFEIPTHLLNSVSDSLRNNKFKIKNPVLKEFISWIKEEELKPAVATLGTQWWVENVSIGAEVPKKLVNQARRESVSPT